MSSEPTPILSRQQRRAQARAAARHVLSNGHGAAPRAVGPVPLCAAGTHLYSKVTGTVGNEPIGTVVICSVCRRTFQQVMEESPEDLAIYRAFLERERAKTEHDHEPDPDGLPVEGCAGCDMLKAIDGLDPGES